MSIGVTAEIKSKLDIVEIVGESVALKKAGTTFKGLCPFHGERTPSFVVTPARESWHCFGCGLGGDVFSFVMQREGIDFPEALRRLAARAGVELDERTSREDARKKRLREVMEAAVAFYHQVLTASRHGQAALEYLRGRGLTDKTVETFRLGWAPDSWDPLTRALTKKRDVREDELEAAGLAVRGRRQGVYDRFRGRIIFPIRDASGNATGMGGRVLPGAGAAVAGAAGGASVPGAATSAAGGPVGAQRDGDADHGPKYLNSPATPLFDKSRTLYLIDRAKGPIRRSKQAVIVEGYTDALMAHQEGFENVVAGLGTALTAGQVELVTRYAPSIALAYDVDPAGQSAGTFGATELSALIGEIGRSGAKVGIADVGVVRLPEGKDPDEVIRENRAVWEAAVAEPQGIVDYLIDYYAGRHDVRTPQGRKRLVAAMVPTLRAIGDPTVRDYYMQRLANRSGIQDGVLRQEMARPASAGGRGTGSGSASSFDGEHVGARITADAVLASRESVDPEVALRAIDPIERTLLRLVLRYPEQQQRLEIELAPEQLLTTPARELWARILADRAAAEGTAAGTSGSFDLVRFVRGLDPELGAIARAVVTHEDAPVPEHLIGQGVDQCLVRLELRRLAEHVDFVRAELAEAEARHDSAAHESLVDQIRTLEQQRAELDRRAASTTVLTRSSPAPAHSTTSTPSTTASPAPDQGGRP